MRSSGKYIVVLWRYSTTDTNKIAISGPSLLLRKKLGSVSLTCSISRLEILTVTDSLFKLSASHSHFSSTQCRVPLALSRHVGRLIARPHPWTPVEVGSWDTGCNCVGISSKGTTEIKISQYHFIFVSETCSPSSAHQYQYWEFKPHKWDNNIKGLGNLSKAKELPKLR